VSDLVRIEALAPAEQTRLAELEAVVERGMQTFVEVGLALTEIRDARLYRETHGTFETYLAARWGMSRANGYRMIDAAQVAELVSPMGDIQNERQARELVPLLADETAVIEVWRELKAEHGDKVTAEKVRTAVRQRLKYGEIGDTWPGSSCARMLRERRQDVDASLLDLLDLELRIAEADYDAAKFMWEGGQILLRADEPDELAEACPDPKRAHGALAIARKFPSRLSLQLAIDALEGDPGFVSWQMLARWR